MAPRWRCYQEIRCDCDRDRRRTRQIDGRDSRIAELEERIGQLEDELELARRAHASAEAALDDADKRILELRFRLDHPEAAAAELEEDEGGTPPIPYDVGNGIPGRNE